MSINMEFRSVVFNAARDGKLRRLKVGPTFGLFYYYFFFACYFDKSSKKSSLITNKSRKNAADSTNVIT